MANPKPSTTLGVILLAGGKGIRMGGPVPKQFLMLKQKPIARYSFDLFGSLPEVRAIAVVCPPEYTATFSCSRSDIQLSFAPPGARRQDSVWNGFRSLAAECDLICIHDAVRPFIDSLMIREVVDAASHCGAAALGMPVKYTVKCCDRNQMVTQTLDRSLLMEIQTPQVLRREVLEKGFQKALEGRVEVTDDVSLAELTGCPVKIVEGSYRNLKITTPEDLLLSQLYLQ